MASLLWKQIKALLYRTFLLKIRIKSITFQEVVMPIYFVVILVILKVAAYKPQFFPVSPNNFTVSLLQHPVANNSLFYVAPNFPEAKELMEYIKNNVLTGSQYQMFPDQAAMDDSYNASSTSSAIGIYFPESGVITKYALRYPYPQAPGEGLYDNSPGSCRNRSGCSADWYLNTGFVSLQNIIDSAIVQNFVNSSYVRPAISVQPYPKNEAYANSQVFQIISSIYLVMAFAPFMSMLLVFIVIEKQKKIKEGMKMMGLSSLAHWLSWGISYFIIIFVMSLVVALIAKFGQLFPKCDFFILFFLFFLYGLTLEMLGFLLSTFFTNPKSAGAIGMLLTTITALLSLVPMFTSMSQSAFYAICLISPAGFATAIGQVALLDLSTGVSFSNLWSSQYPIGIALIMLTVDIFLYFIITLYLDKVVPGEYGQRTSPFFCLQPSFWFPNKRSKAYSDGSDAIEGDENAEKVDDSLLGKEVVRIRNITKVYSSDGILTKQTSSTTAVKNFSIDIYEGQITALLGHNGAGKTTLFNILTGFTDATSGYATVYGYDVSNAQHMTEIRKMTGVCPQHNILIDVLTVMEHLKMFAGIKGLSGEHAKDEVERIVKLIGLNTQRDTMAKKLSGGQMRKLSVGIAIMGDPKILILDEPTAGMDPFSRNNLWDVLRSRKEGRITLLTTHFMDEADILADRKAIISRGSLRCVGSSLFLKNRYGVGYHLGVVTKTSSNHQPITDCIISHVSGAELQRSIGFELGYTLPLSQVGNFAGLFQNLEESAEKLKVQSFGVSMTTLEEVFLKIGEEDEGDEESEDSTSSGPLIPNDEALRQRVGSVSSGIVNPSYGATNKNETELYNGSGVDVVVRVNKRSAFDPEQSESGKKSTKAIYKAMLWRMFLVYIRNPGVIFFGFVLPIGLVIGSCAVLNLTTVSDSTTDPPLVDINPSAYNNTMLFKNSSGAPLIPLLNDVNKTVAIDDLTNLLNSQTYLAADVKEYALTKINYLALYKTQGVHSLPAVVNTISSAMLKGFNSSAPLITTYNKRWPSTGGGLPFSGGLFGGSILAGSALILALALGALNPVQERELKITTQLRVSGVTSRMYWIASFTVDYLWYFVIAAVFIISILAFQVRAFNPGAIGALILLLIGWGGAGVLTSYCGSFMFDRYETAQSTWFNIVQLSSLIPFLIVSLVDSLGSPTIALALNVVFVVISPVYTGYSGIYYINRIYTEYAYRGLDTIPNSIYFDWTQPMVPFAILMTYVHVVVLSILLLVLNVIKDGGKASDVFKINSRYRTVTDNSNPSPRLPRSDEERDSDVIEEERRVEQVASGQNLDDQQPVVLVHKLHKVFVKGAKKAKLFKKEKKGTTKVAVGDLSLSVVPGQVLGLLGPNGAGKTTAINMITADIAPTSGKVVISGHEIHSNLSAAYQDMGYCPQHNPLWENITLKEHLEIYATTHGIPPNKIKLTVHNFMEALGILEHKHKRSQALSGGTKRKLCFAISMMGNPQVVLLDEPSTGMDPKTKRFMWDTISTAFEDTNRGAILTTHYMEEADALCSRVAIMVLGNLKCIGSTQHLKSKFGQGYVLEVKLNKADDENEEALHKFVVELFGEDIKNPEKFSNRFVYKVSQESVKNLSTVFSHFEEAKQMLGIEEYSFSQATLEQVFLRFAREQEREEELEAGRSPDQDAVNNDE